MGMRDRLRRKLKKREKERQEKKCANNVSSRPPLEDAPSPSLSSSTQSRDKSEVDIFRNSKTKNQNGKKVPYGFGMAMEFRPVRNSTSSKNQENQEENDWKREWIELAFEEFREVAVREKMQVPVSTSLLALQNCLRTAIKSRLKT